MNEDRLTPTTLKSVTTNSPDGACRTTTDDMPLMADAETYRRRAKQLRDSGCDALAAKAETLATMMSLGCMPIFLESIIQRGAHGVALFFWVDGTLSLGLGFVLLAEAVLLFAPRIGVQRFEKRGDGALR